MVGAFVVASHVLKSSTKYDVCVLNVTAVCGVPIMNRDALLAPYVPNVPAAALLAMPYSTQPTAFKVPAVAPTPCAVQVTMISKSNAAVAEVMTVVRVPVLASTIALSVPADVSRAAVKIVVRAAVGVAHDPPPLRSNAFPGVVPPCVLKKLAGSAYAGFAAVLPDITVATAAVTADPDAAAFQFAAVACSRVVEPTDTDVVPDAPGSAVCSSIHVADGAVNAVPSIMSS